MATLHHALDQSGNEKLVLLGKVHNDDQGHGGEDNQKTIMSHGSIPSATKKRKLPSGPYQGHTTTVMMDWETPYMKRLVKELKLTPKDVSDENHADGDHGDPQLLLMRRR